MLREIKNVKQSDPQLTRSWFQSDYFELFVWRGEDGAIRTFQLCYDLRRRERALTWKEGAGFYHDGVDDGETQGPQGSHNASALLTGTSRGPFDAEKVNSRFMRESAELPMELRTFVIGKLHEYAITGPVKRREPPRRTVRRDDWQKAAGSAAMAPQEADAGPADAGTPDKPAPN